MKGKGRGGDIVATEERVGLSAGRAGGLRARLLALRPAIAKAAQAVVDAWEQDEDGMDDELGAGGVCGRVSEAISGVVYEKLEGVETTDGGQDGDDHAFPIVYDDKEAFAVDIPPGVYETGGGYRWKKRRGARITADDVVIDPVRRSDVVDSDGYARGQSSKLDQGRASSRNSKMAAQQQRADVANRFREMRLSPIRRGMRKFERAMAEEFPRVTLITSLTGGVLVAGLLEVPRAMRKQGVGSEVMRRLTAFADAHALPMRLSVGQRGELGGTTSASRLVRFYERFGFRLREGSRTEMERSAAQGVGLSSGHAHAFLPLSTVKVYEAEARRLGVSKVARSATGFLAAYKRAGGVPERLSEAWIRKREGFIARHMAEAKNNGESFALGDKLTRRHLALIMWAYSPKAKAAR